MKRKQIDFGEAMSILEANYKLDGYSVKKFVHDVGPLCAHRAVSIYSVNDKEILRSSVSIANDGDPRFFIPILLGTN